MFLLGGLNLLLFPIFETFFGGYSVIFAFFPLFPVFFITGKNLNEITFQSLFLGGVLEYFLIGSLLYLIREVWMKKNKEIGRSLFSF